MRIRTLFLVLTLLLACSSVASAQKIAVKSNLLYDATGTINLGAEFSLSKKWTFDLSGNYNRWNMSSDGLTKWKHAFLQPELRYWFCEGFNGSFFAMHLLGGAYNVGGIKDLEGIKFAGKDFANLANYRYEGWFVGAGLGYGYSWVLAKNWNVEAEIAAGYLFSPKSRKYECEECGMLLDGEPRNRGTLSLTKLALNIVYVF